MKPNLAIIGMGPMGQRHYEACRKINYKKIFLCDLKLDALNKFKSDAIYKNWKKLINNNKIDLLIVSSTADTHYEIVEYAIKKKIKKILCEKPLTNSLIKAERLITLCNKNKTLVAVNHIRRWSDSYLKLKKLARSKLMGGIKNIYFEMGGGQLASNGGHLFDLSRFLTDCEPKTIISTLDKKNTPHPRGKKFKDPGGFGILILENNIRVFFDMSEDYGTPTIIKILCKYGNILIDEKNKIWRIFARKSRDRKIPLTKRPPLKKVKFEGHGMIDMVESSKKTIKNLLKVNTQSEINCNIQDGYKSLSIAIAAHFSHIKKTNIKFPIINKYIKNKNFKFT